ncbi:hypothetical protein M8494_27060 [Serratia ureilytica]
MRDNATLRPGGRQEPDRVGAGRLAGSPSSRTARYAEHAGLRRTAERCSAMAGLVNYRVTWGGLPADITAEQVKALRK